jgi:hypothetical protein
MIIFEMFFFGKTIGAVFRGDNRLLERDRCLSPAAADAEVTTLTASSSTSTSSSSSSSTLSSPCCCCCCCC